jgi:hypothetical protein
MSDSLYLSLWFPSFEAHEMLPHAVAVLAQFPFSHQRPGVTYLALHPVSWSEPTILERRFQPGVTPLEAMEAAHELLHEDYAYVFTVYWDLWTPAAPGQWHLQPAAVKVMVQGPEFEDRTAEETGHIEVDFGLDTPFLQEEFALQEDDGLRVRSNIQKLVDFINKIERNTAATGRLLWSESEENLAQKLIARLQKVQ